MRNQLLFFLFILFFQINFSQTSSFDFGVFIDGQELNNVRCLDNEADYSTLEIRELLGNENDISNVSIIANLDNKASQSFSSFEAFKTFNFKFWLLSNNAYKTVQSLNIIINATDNSNTTTIEQITICLRYVDPATVDRGGEQKPDYVKMPVYFATDRNYVKSDDVYKTFGSERSDLKYGICEVSIPHDHKIGEIESPSIWRFEFTEDPNKHIVLHEIDLLEKDNFFNALRDDIQSTEGKKSFLFVHGYNVSFGDAAKRTAQISYDLLFDGKAVFYSWPSQASLLGYSKDEKTIEWAQKNIRNFLEDYITRSGAEEIYLVAHSMGNRGLTRAIIDLMNDRPELRAKIKEVILAAPDIDAEVFKNEIAPKMVSKVQRPITLYVSSDDLALKASKKLHGRTRAGDSGDGVVLVDGVETIDASGVDTSFLSHSYFADTSSIISDIFDLIKTGKRALKRDRLKLVKIEDNMYWKVKQ